jgi:hypothetical protein
MHAYAAVTCDLLEAIRVARVHHRLPAACSDAFQGRLPFTHNWLQCIGLGCSAWAAATVSPAWTHINGTFPPLHECAVDAPCAPHAHAPCLLVALLLPRSFNTPRFLGSSPLLLATPHAHKTFWEGEVWVVRSKAHAARSPASTRFSFREGAISFGTAMSAVFTI